MKKNLLLLCAGLTILGHSVFAAAPAVSYNHANSINTEPHLRLQLYKDAINADDTYIGFEPNVQTSFVFNQDAKYMQGQGKISMASISSDNFKLAINRVPLPAQSESIRLYVNATEDGTYQLNMTEDVDMPPVYDVWLMDAYKKDSLKMNQNSSYTFSLLKADTNSFGSNRFSLVIRQNAALAFHLVDFTAEKVAGGVETAWKTENEQGYTNFTVERSNDGGQTYDNIDSLLSDSLGAYSFIDKSQAATAAGATDQYRLKIQDLSGAVSYSNVVTLMYSNAAIAHNSLNVYPNPATGVVNFSIVADDASTADKTTYGIKIVNLSGTVIRTATTAGQSWQTDVSNLMPGTYIVQMVKNADGSIAGKSTFIKL